MIKAANNRNNTDRNACPHQPIIKNKGKMAELYKTRTTMRQAQLMINKLDSQLQAGCVNYEPVTEDLTVAFKAVCGSVPISLADELEELRQEYTIPKKQLLAAAIHQFLAMPESDRLRLCRDTLAEYYAA